MAVGISLQHCSFQIFSTCHLCCLLFWHPSYENVGVFCRLALAYFFPSWLSHSQGLSCYLRTNDTHIWSSPSTKVVYRTAFGKCPLGCWFCKNLELNMSKTDLWIFSPYFIFFAVSLSVTNCVLGQSIQKTRFLQLSPVNHRVNWFFMLMCQHHTPTPKPLLIWESYHSLMSMLNLSSPPSLEHIHSPAFDVRNLPGMELSCSLSVELTCHWW